MLTIKEDNSVTEFTEYRDSIEYLESLSTEAYKHSMFALSHPGRYTLEEIGESIVKYNHIQRALDVMKLLRIPVNLNEILEFFQKERVVYVEYRDKSKKIKKRKVQQEMIETKYGNLDLETGEIEERSSFTSIDSIVVSSKNKKKHFRISDYNKTYRFWMEKPNRIEVNFPWEYDERFDEADDDIAD